ncbi:2-oxo-4-hydroxy-4-carboxy-5-ureidoimidazoline decarboxylase [Halomarina ordinaria]|uniref:2-oxo-4-hydroxy-4-carboxy-5-ureidoimidazoline decarboxylase n=1 Tax=Halomarina ordinaria TaxID=3033939 RepID=A0ABD5UCR3_9EURY|nr:2-oxo-4-hydroxy-4-carboxy-5-ureidoimidazoline decarboxylase [Halomarina sp. PSRA2]
MSVRTLGDLNELDDDAFVDELRDVYEHSPWVAERAASARPFETVSDLHTEMARVVREADEAEQLELLRAHPDLGERTEMTDASEAEQSSAGLDELGPEQYETFQRLNERYQRRFEFPFIMAVKGASPDEIQAAMEARVENDESTEFRTALEEVDEIARLRLDDRFREAGDS